MLGRDIPLLIAIPTPPETIRDPMRFAKAALGQWGWMVTEAEEREIAIWPTRRRHPLPENMTELLGGIPRRLTPGFSVSIGVVVARVERRPLTRPPHRIQWPGNYMVDGMPQLPAENS